MALSVPLLHQSTSPDVQLTAITAHKHSSSSVSSNNTDESNIKWHSKPTNRIRFVVLLLLLSVLSVAVIFHDTTLHYCAIFLDWMYDNPAQGSFAFIGLYIICSVFMLPGSLLTLGAGYVYVGMFGRIKGLIISSVVVWIGASVGATLAFINGRYLLGNLVKHFIARSAKFSLIDTVVAMNGFKVTFLLRLSPITPYNVFNYLMALTSVKLTDYMLACVGMIPDSIVYCFIGGTIASIAKLSSVGFTSHPMLLAITIVGTIVAICGIVYVSYLGKKEFDKLASQSEIKIQNGQQQKDTMNSECEDHLKNDVCIP